MCNEMEVAQLEGKSRGLECFEILESAEGYNVMRLSGSSWQAEGPDAL